MDIKKLNPWNWFKHEEQLPNKNEVIPVKQGDYLQGQHPMSNMMQLHREIDRVFDNAFREFRLGYGLPSFNQSPLWQQLMNDDFAPAFRANVNIASNDKQYTITLEAPGLQQEDLSIELKDRTLVIKGNKQQEQKEEDKHYYRVERHYGSFERVLAIPDDASSGDIIASMKNGVLSINIPRKEMPASATKKIEIK